MTGTVFDIQRFSVHDGPGLRTTVFLKGCPLRCAWCQNPEGLCRDLRLWLFDALCAGCGACRTVCPTGALGEGEGGKPVIDHESCVQCGTCVDRCNHNALALDGHEISVEEILKKLLGDKVFYDSSAGGATFSGGEPLSQAAFVAAVAERLKEEKIHTSVETSLMGEWNDIERWLGCIDYFHADLKILDPARHKKAVGTDNARILANFERLARDIGPAGRLKVRVPLVPGYTDDAENLRSIGAYVYGIGGGNIPVELMNYNPLAESKYRRMGRAFPLSGAKAFDDVEMERFEEFLVSAMRKTTARFK